MPSDSIILNCRRMSVMKLTMIQQLSGKTHIILRSWSEWRKVILMRSSLIYTSTSNANDSTFVVTSYSLASFMTSPSSLSLYHIYPLFISSFLSYFLLFFPGNLESYLVSKLVLTFSNAGISLGLTLEVLGLTVWAPTTKLYMIITV